MAKNSMIDAAVHLKEIEKTDIGVSVDGTWKKRGFSSLSCVVAAISSMKMLQIKNGFFQGAQDSSHIVFRFFFHSKYHQKQIEKPTQEEKRTLANHLIININQ